MRITSCEYVAWFRFVFSSRRRHTRWPRDWSSDVCSSDLRVQLHGLESVAYLRLRALENAHRDLTAVRSVWGKQRGYHSLRSAKRSIAAGDSNARVQDSVLRKENPSRFAGGFSKTPCTRPWGLSHKIPLVRVSKSLLRSAFVAASTSFLFGCTLLRSWGECPRPDYWGRAG